MKIVGIGDLVLDYYFKEEKNIGVNGGMSFANIIANLAKLENETKILAGVGNDIMGDICVQSLKNLGVDTNYIKKEDINTRRFYVSYKENTITSKKRCPICGKKCWYEKDIINENYIINSIANDDLLVFDNISDTVCNIISKTSNIKFLDLGQYYSLEELSDNEIIYRLAKNFIIINFNERVWNYLKKRFNASDEYLANLLSTKLISITKGNKGCTFIYNNQIFEFPLQTKSDGIDATGCGDAFFACLINEYIKNNLTIDSKDLENWFNKAVSVTTEVVKNIGARGHIQDLYKIKPVSNKCLCEDFTIVKKRVVKRCNINVNNLETRVINALKTESYQDINNINFQSQGNYIFTGTGGSYATAIFASICINDLYSCNTYHLLPRDILHRNNDNITSVIMFSYSGTTNDLITSTSNFTPETKYIITKGEKNKICEKTNLSSNNIISYRSNFNKTRERGFLSFEGVISPCSLFLKYYYTKKDPNFVVENFISSSFQKWNNYFNELFKEKRVRNIIKLGNTINIFGGDYCKCAEYDLESKLIESGTMNAICHEKKNFSHGRFINYEHLNNKCSIYLESSNNSPYEEVLLSYLDKEKTIIIQSDYSGILCEYDLLIASQYLIYNIGKLLNIDMSKPTYSDEDMKLYFYKGIL